MKNSKIKGLIFYLIYIINLSNCLIRVEDSIIKDITLSNTGVPGGGARFTDITAFSSGKSGVVWVNESNKINAAIFKHGQIQNGGVMNNISEESINWVTCTTYTNPSGEEKLAMLYGMRMSDSKYRLRIANLDNTFYTEEIEVTGTYINSAGIVHMIGGTNIGITAEQNGVDTNGSGLIFTVVDAETNNISIRESLVNTEDQSLNQEYPGITSLPNEETLVIWGVYGSGQATGKFYWQKYDKDGNKIGTNYKILETPGYRHVDPQSSVTPDGGFTILWTAQNHNDSNFYMHMQSYDSQYQQVCYEVIQNRTDGVNVAQSGHTTLISFLTQATWIAKGMFADSRTCLVTQQPEQMVQTSQKLRVPKIALVQNEQGEGIIMSSYCTWLSSGNRIGYSEYFVNPGQCSYICNGCTGSSTTCNACSHSTRDFGNNCLCKPSFFDDGHGECKTCNKACTTCEKGQDNCTQCVYPGVLTRYDLPSCQCKQGFYPVEGQAKCETCSKNCKNCDNGTTCTECFDPKGRLPNCDCIIDVEPFYEWIVFPGFFLSGYNDRRITTNVTRENCKQLCEQETAFVCLSIDFVTDQSLCDLSSFDSLTAPLSGGPGVACSGPSYCDHYVAIRYPTCQCDYQCATCTVSIDNCQSCSDSNRDINNQCSCKLGFFEDGNQNQTCGTCDNTLCATCTSLTDCILTCNDTCKTCDISGKCISCEENEFINSEQLCEPCNQKCATCSTNKDNCDSCIDEFSRNLSDQCNCNIGFYSEDNECKMCLPKCKSCSNGTSCNECIYAHQKQPDCECTFSIQTGTLLTDNYEYIANSYLKLNDTRGITTSPTRQECIDECNNETGFECQTVDYKNNESSCYLSSKHITDPGMETPSDSTWDLYARYRLPACQCHYKCSICSTSLDNCDTCSDLTTRDSGNNCQCKNNYYDNGVAVCASCMGLCETCDNGSTCITCKTTIPQRVGPNCDCPDKYFNNGSNQCEDCRSNCLTCENNSSCKVCLDENKVAPDCLCASKFYADSEFNCIKCQDQCQTCEDGNSCKTCPSDSHRKGIKCECEAGYFDNGSLICQKCDEKCQYCQGTASNCLICQIQEGRNKNPPTCDCQQYYYMDVNDQTCHKCLGKCLTCNNTNSCLTCLNNQFQPPNCENSQKISFSVTIDSNNQENIVICDKQCESCQAASNNCLTCNTINRINNPPHCNCISGFYQDNQSGQCEQCSKNCLECSETQQQCTKCDSAKNLVLDKFTLQCSCPVNHIMDEGKCQACFIFNNQCFLKCPQNTYEDKQNLQCFEKTFKLENNTSVIFIIGVSILLMMVMSKLIIKILSQKISSNIIYITNTQKQAEFQKIKQNENKLKTDSNGSEEDNQV